MNKRKPKPFPWNQVGYIAWFDEAEKRAAKGEQQTQCSCGRWLWSDQSCGPHKVLDA